MNKTKSLPIGATKAMETMVVEKAWGREIIFANSPLYCGKLLEFKDGSKFSMHFHIIKDETWWVQSGEFIYRWMNYTQTKDLCVSDQFGHLFRRFNACARFLWSYLSSTSVISRSN